jgi:D-beta-D-heptose 7-phosphate kinase/D-beta-D-heptose 1-phosphate adenosyltransferase
MSVLVFGDIMLDKYIEGTVTRISPEAPVPVVHIQNIYNAIGGCGNVSNGIEALQVSSELIALVGKDEHAKELKKLLAGKNIMAKLVEQDLPTITKVRIVSNQHQLLRYDLEKIEPPSLKTVLKIKEWIGKSKAGIAIISDYGKGACTAEACQYLINSFLKKKKKVLVDPKTSNWSKYAGAFLVSPNFNEFCLALGKTIPNENRIIETEARKLMQAFKLEHILVTRSAKGMSLISEKEAFHIPATAKEVYDVTGAGDTVIAILGAFLSKKKSLKESAVLAGKAAAIAIAHFGTHAVTKKELFG